MTALASHLQIIATLQFLLISIFLSVSWMRHKRVAVVGFLAIFFGAKMLAMLDFTLSMSFRRWVLHEFPLLDVILLPFLYLYIPAYYLFVRASCDSKFKLTWKDAFHAIPAIALLVLILVRYLSIDDSLSFRILATNQFFSAWEKLAVFKIRNLVVVTYLVVCLIEIKRYHGELRRQFSDQRVRQLRWLIWLTIALGAISCWYLLLSAMSVFFVPSPDARKVMHIVSTVLLFLFANGVVYKSLNHFPFDLADKRSKPASVKNSMSERRDWDRLMHCMESERAYLQEGLKLEELASMLKLSPRYVTELIHTNTKSNFYSFVNGFRIQEAKTRLINAPSSSVLEILHDSGFNSKSTFNEVFKQSEGLTPTQYRRQNISSVQPPITADQTSG